MKKLPFGLGRRSTRGHVRRVKRTSIPWWLVASIGLIGLLAILALLGIFTGDDENEESVTYHNRTWLDSTWTTNQPSRAQVEALAERLAEHDIDTIYVETGTWLQNNTYREHEFAEEFRRMMAEVVPDVRVLVWVWARADQFNEVDAHLALQTYLSTALRDWGYDGVHLQGISVNGGNPNYVDMVRAVDTVVDDNDGYLSITVPPDHQPSDPDVPLSIGNPAVSWSPRYKQQIGLIVDEMVIMAHSSGLKDVDEYEEWMAYQIATYASDIQRVNESVELIIVLPAYPPEGAHMVDVENVETAIAATRRGLNEAGGARRMIRGAGMYIYDTATTEDWAIFKEEWVER
ncbi:MAG: glycoside hydrolase family 18 protein [Chloroflexi bacterium]|nr:glycoside hydrolase family 18 protein [Chloroflexota bacterium]